MPLPRFTTADPGRVQGRQNGSPCPGKDGTKLGSFQEFTVLCNTSLGGDVLDRLDAFDFTACVDICSSFHPKCEGVSFNGSLCTLRARLRPQEQRRSRRIDSAIGSFPGASSNCPTLGGTQQILDKSFTTMCGFIIAGNDLSQNFAPTFQDCLGQCATTSGCAAVSFDPSQDLGFKNCYLKTPVSNSSAVAADRRTDSAMLAADPPPPGSSTANPPVTLVPLPPSNDPGVSTVPLPSPSPSPTVPAGGAIFFTPPGGNPTTAAAPEASVPAISDFLTSGSPSSSATTATLPFASPTVSGTPTPSLGDARAPETAADERDAGGGGDSSSSDAWIAAPVVGSVAAVALIAVSFVMLKRRRRGGRRGASGRRGLDTSGPSRLWGMWTAWLPASWASRSSRGGSGSQSHGQRQRGMGIPSEAESGQGHGEGQGQGAEVSVSMRSSVAGFLSGRPMGMERLEDIEEGGAAEKSGTKKGRTKLRNSYNGLEQNRWS
ncbi:hypothetical protein VTK26DRAFT_9462 [Humicola hyalothermophila]